MIQEFFQLQRRPFVSTPAPEHYFPASSSEAARSSLLRLIERNEGPGLVIGPVGTGKSMLCRLLANTFRQRYRVVVLAMGRMVDRRALLQSILFELGLPYRSLDESELRLSLIDHLMNRELCPHGLLVLVDEADGLSHAVLNELRSLNSLAWDDGGCVRMVLFGSPRLEEKFTHPRLESFNQRVIGRFYLEPFNANETRRYIERTFAACGGDPYDVFTPEALQKIHDACGGIPRLVNQLTDHVLVLAATGNRELVDSASVDDAWADLQQLPTPHRGSARGHQSQGSAPMNVVEFGGLDEIDDQPMVNDAQACGVDDPAATPSITWPQTHHNPSPNDRCIEVGPPADADNDLDTAAEYTLVFHSAENPFGDDFEEEEIVIDQFVSPDALAQRHRRQVVAAASERLAELMLRLRAQALTSAGNEAMPSGEQRGTEPSHEPGSSETDPAIIYMGDRVVRSDEEREVESLCATSVVPASSNRRSMDSASTTSPRNYHNLFSQLRRRG